MSTPFPLIPFLPRPPTHSQENIKEAVITQVSFVSRDAIDKKLFSYITHEPAVGLMMCHAFSVKAKVERIPATLNQAFMINSGKVRARVVAEGFGEGGKGGWAANVPPRPLTLLSPCLTPPPSLASAPSQITEPRGSKFHIKRSQKEALKHANEFKKNERRESKESASPLPPIPPLPPGRALEPRALISPPLPNTQLPWAATRQNTWALWPCGSRAATPWRSTPSRASR